VPENTVEWSLIDYGEANFYVASYRRPEAETTVEAVTQVAETEPETGCRWSNCIPLFRCWSAARGARAAA
jgi:hypothetical protein